MIEIVLDILMIIGLMGMSFCCGKFLGYKILEKQRQRVVRRNVADHLLANGVICPPCKVGDMVYWAFYDKGEEIAEVFEGFIRGMSIGHNGTTWFSVVYNNGLTYEHTFEDYWNNTVFLTREEAERALAKKGGAE